MTFEIVFVMLFAVASVVAMLARRLKIPYTVALVATGLLLGAVDGFEAPKLTKELLFAVFLPGLLFEAAFHLEFKKFWKNKLAVTSLAIPGLLAAIGLTAVMLVGAVSSLGLAQEFSLIHGLVFASLIAATDPIAVVGLFKSLGAPKRLAILVEGESLINDGTAVVVFTLMFGLALGGELSMGHAIGQFMVVAGAGAIVGTLFGLCVSWLTHRIDDPMVEITLTTIAAYGAFAVAEHFHVSGVIATVVAGMLCGNYGARTGMSPSTKVAVLSFWDYLVFALNSIVFLLIGLEVDHTLLLTYWQPIVIAFVAVLVARTVVVYTASGLLRWTREAFPWRWSAILTWGGLRGSLSMVLVLALPDDFPHRELLVTMTFGVVLLSIIGQGLTIGPLMRRLGLSNVLGGQHEAYEHHRGEIRAARHVLDELQRMEEKREASRDVLDQLRQAYQERLAHAENRIADLHLAHAELREQQHKEVARHLLLVEKESLIESYRSGFIAEQTHDALLANLDARVIALEEGDHGTPESDA